MRFPFQVEHFRQAFRTTVTIALPVFVLYYLGYESHAIATGLGALSVALSDIPNDIRQKSRALPGSSVLLAVVALAVGFLIPHPVWLGALLAVFCFCFSMLIVFGGAVSAIGNLALIMMVFTIGLKPANPLAFSAAILGGGLLYSLSALLYAFVYPHRHIELGLNECINEIADFLKTKACFYNPATDLETCYRQVIPGHLKVTEKQDKVRQTLLREPVLLRPGRTKGKRLLQQATELIDLYEQVLSIHQDYNLMRQTLTKAGILGTVRELIELQAAELRRPDSAFKDQSDALLQQLFNAQLNAAGADALLIKRLTDNFISIRDSISAIKNPAAQSEHHAIPVHDALQFSGTPAISLNQLRQHLNYQSAVFRFSLRMALCCLAAYIAMVFWLPGVYNYWLLLTIVIVARPSFSTTHSRNLQRLTGSLLGVAIAFLFLRFTYGVPSQLLVIIGCLFGYLSFLHINYRASVVFITIVAILGLGLLGGKNHELLWERAFDTLLGCGIALAASFLFPFWESRRLKDQVTDVLSANINYLEHFKAFAINGTYNPVNYKLARKQMFNSAANLSKTYQHMLAEPAKAGNDHDAVQTLQILSHQLYGAVASLFSNRQAALQHRNHYILQADEAISCLKAGLKAFKEAGRNHVQSPIITNIAETDLNADTTVTEQLHFVNRLARQLSNHSASLAIRN